MTVVLGQAEIEQAIAQYLGGYKVNSVRIIVGRGKSNSRIEVEVEKDVVDTTNFLHTEPGVKGTEKVEEPKTVAEPETEVVVPQGRSIFDSIEE